MFIIDHHCSWVNNCIGEHNIRKFYLFLVSILIHALCIIIGSFIIFIKNRLDTKDWEYYDYFTVFFLVYSIGIFMCMIIAVISQCWLISNNVTTNECIRSRLPNDTYDNGCSNNWKKTFNC